MAILPQNARSVLYQLRLSRSVPEQAELRSCQFRHWPEADRRMSRGIGKYCPAARRVPDAFTLSMSKLHADKLRIQSISRPEVSVR